MFIKAMYQAHSLEPENPFFYFKKQESIEL